MYKKIIISLFLLFTLHTSSLAEEEFLRPEKAFAISAEAIDKGTVRVNWQIADGYYLYQSKFRFQTEESNISLGEPTLPPAISKNDPIFGEVQIYRQQVSIDVPLEQRPLNLSAVTLKIRSQGCADKGICYPPQTQTLLVALDAAADKPSVTDPSQIAEMSGEGSAAPSAVSNISDPDPLLELSALGDELGLDDEDDILSPEQAFKVDALSLDGKSLKLQWTIADETYLYQDKVKIEVVADGVSLGEYQLPKPDIKKDSIKPDGSVGDVAVYHHAINLDIPLLRSNVEATEIEVKTRFQGCADRGICYPPQKKSFKIALPAVDASSAVIASAAAAVPSPVAATSSEPVAEQDQLIGMLSGQSTWFIIGAFFLIGLGLAFTPCVFPMIPILSGIITGHGNSITTRKAFSLSVVYVLAMAITYTAAGVFAAMAGENLQAALQNPVVLSVFALMFVLLSLSMFGFYDLQLPASWQSKLAEISNRQQGGHLAGAAIMGLLSALIVGPCVAPPLAAALIYISQTGDTVLGGIALFAMAMGMGAPLIVIGTSAGKLLPRAGGWMDAVKAVFGVVMLGLAIYMLERILSESIIMLLWGVLAIISAIYMGAISHLPEDASGWKKLWKGAGFALLVYGCMFLIGVAANNEDTRQPLRGLFGSSVAGTSNTGAQHVNFKQVKTVADLNREVAAAKAAGKSVMLDFYADWCTYCKTMEKDIFPNAAVQAALTNTVLLQADVTDQDEADIALSQHLQMIAPPALYFWSADGVERKNFRLVGNVTAEQLAAHINKVFK